MIKLRAYIEILSDDGTATRAFANITHMPGEYVLLNYGERGDGDATFSTLRLYENHSSLIKTGACRAELSFLPLEKTTGVYDAGLGPWEAEVETLEYAAKLKLDGSAIIRYKLNLSGQDMGVRELRVKWRAKANPDE